MANSECKEIENCIKAILFKGPIAERKIDQPATSRNPNHNPFSVDNRCLVSNIENASSTIPPHSSSKSELIDFNVLTNFAAQHIDSLPFTSPLALATNELVLPHPDLEDGGLTRNGESGPGISGLLNTMTKEIQNSPNFLSMPENPVFGTPKKSRKSASVPPDKKEEEKSKQKRKSKSQMKQKKKKERMDGLYIPKEGGEVESRTGNRTSPFRNEDVKVIAKRPVAEENETPCIKMKKNPLSELTPEYYIFLQEDQYKFQCCLCAYNAELKDAIIKHLNLKNHRSLKTQGDLDMMLPFLPSPLIQQTESITRLLSKTIEVKGLREEHRNIRSNLCIKLQQFVNQNLPSCSVELVGSSASGCGLKESEVDFVLKVPSVESTPDCLEKIYLLMKSKGYGKSLRCSWICKGSFKRWRPGDTFYKVLDDFRKKRPCIKFTDGDTYLPCNILIDNLSSLKLASLLTTYLKLDKRALNLGIAVRHWAKLCEIDQQENGTFPSFCHTLMLVHFLQQVQPPVLPVLHELKDYASVPEFYEEYLKSDQWKSQNTDCLGELWLKYFHFYNFEYKLGEHVVCIRNSKRVTCKERNWSTRFYAIEDPFLKRNLAYVIPTFQVCNYISQCYLRTYRYFAFPQLKNGFVKLMKTSSFDALKLSEYVTNKPASKQDDSEDSEESDNEDNDGAAPDLEDHDPDLPVEEFIAAMSNISLDETQEVTKSNELEKLLSSGASKLATENTSTPLKLSEKAAKDTLNKSTANAPSICYWDVQPGLDIRVEAFSYELQAVTFKGEKPFPLTCKACKASGHRKQDCPVDDLPTPAPLPKMTPEFLKIITNVLYSIRDQFIVSKAELDFIDADMRNVQAYIREVFPDASLKLFGSFCNGFGFRNQSDMDFCLTFGDRNDGKDLDSAEVIQKIAKELRQHSELTNVLPITSAKVPIVKFTWYKSGLEGDISLYNTLALANTELLEAYSKIDSRVQILGYAFKHFAKLLGICDASRGSLSSYAYILMVIFFLQQRNPPVIPVLQELYDGEKPVRLIENWNVWFYKDINNLERVWPDFKKNKESVGELWLGLLNFYTCDFDWKEFVISIKQKSPLTRFRKFWVTAQLAIEDPFDLNHNLGGGLSRKMNTYIMKSFIRARERFGTPACLDKQKPGYEQTYLFNRNFLNSGAEPPQDRGCGNCGKIGHIARNCPQEKACAYCRQPGHLIKNCPKKGRGKKSRERDRNYSFEKPNTDRRNSNDKNNPRIQNQNAKNDYNLTRTYPGMQQPPNALEAQKMLQMGIPTHRLPPPGFPSRNMIQNPPPGFNNNNGNLFQGPGSYPPPFSIKHPYAPPFPRSGGKKNEMMAQSPPKHFGSPPRNFGSSPPKNFPPHNFPPFHNLAKQPWPRQGFNVERHPIPGRNLQPVPLAQRNAVPRNMGPPRNLNPQSGRNQWQGRPLGQHDHPSMYPNSNVDHRLHRSNSDGSSYNSNGLDGW